MKLCHYPVLLWLLLASPVSANNGPLQIFTYHDVVKKLAIGEDRDEMAVTTRALTEHFRWLREHGYQPISIDQLEAASNGGTPLPDKPVMLTFDDGLISTYTEVFPLLKLFNYPAVVSVVTEWVELEKPLMYAKRLRDRDDFVSWDQIREMQASGLVEIASHSHALHRGILVNPQGNDQPAAVARYYRDGEYESDDERRRRLLDDLRRSVDLIRKETGIAPRVMTWPYGAYNELGLEAARRLGMDWTLTLDPNFGNPTDEKTLHRHLIKDNPTLREFSSLLLRTEDPPLVRVAQVQLDHVYDEDPLQQERKLDLMIERMAQLRISHVFLQAFSDLDGDGAAEAMYFPNRHLPVRADLFNRAAWQLKTRSEVTVFAWLPLLGFAGDRVEESWLVRRQTPDGAQPDPGATPRLSPFHVDARRFITDIYRDLGRHAQFEGLHFHDDARLGLLEDASDSAMRAFRERYGMDVDLKVITERPGQARDWAEFKTATLIDLTDELAAVVKPYQPRLQTSRNLLAPAITENAASESLAQDYSRFLEHYDFVTVLAVPDPDRVDPAEVSADFYRALADRARLQDPALGRTIFQLQTVDWRRREPISAVQLKDTLRLLQTIGVRSLAYYPDNFLSNQPELSLLRQGISMAEDLLRRNP